ncbi:MAG: PLP-dependent aminotransferase family protein [Verrucomicrobia bacterium]|nr:PLP-dependent aminotransferase family protein [Verrucomicrobiota bacterium]
MTITPLKLSALGRRARPPAITALMQMALETPGLLSLAAGFTDNATLPVTAVGDALRSMSESGPDREFLQYGTNAGRPGLRTVLAERLLVQDGRGDSAGNGDEVRRWSDRVFVTNGSQQALYLAIQTLCEPGDIVLVDRPSYFVFLELLGGLGVEAKSLPVDASGRLDLAGLRVLLGALRSEGKRERVKAVYFVSWFANPSGRTLDAAEKRGLAETLRAEDCVVPVIEDAAYRELGYDAGAAEAQPGILGDPGWEGFPRLYTSTLTKPFATGLKVGYGACDHDGWRAAMLHVKGHHDFGTGNFAQALLEHALRDGAYDAQLAVLRRAYREKRDALHAALEAGGLRSRGWRWRVPEGGLYLWLEGPATLDTGGDSDFCRACLREGVLYVPGALCHGDHPPKNTVRLSFGVLSVERLAEAGARFCRAAASV